MSHKWLAIALSLILQTHSSSIITVDDYPRALIVSAKTKTPDR
jgi:hypothetical protein